MKKETKIRNNKSFIIFIALLLILTLSCSFFDDKSVISNINVHKWDEITIKVMKDKLNISKHDFDKKNGPPGGIIINGKEYFTMEQFVRSLLKNRAVLINHLKRSKIKSEKLTIIESINFPIKYQSFVIKDDKNEIYKIIIDHNKVTPIIKMKKRDLTFYEKDLLFHSTTDFTDGIKLVVRHLDITTLIYFDNNNKVNYKIKEIWIW